MATYTDLGLNATPATEETLVIVTKTAGAGTISNAGAGSGVITGVGSKFMSEFSIGDHITAAMETRRVLQITDDVTMETEVFTGALSSVGYVIVPANPLRWRMGNNGALSSSAGIFVDRVVNYNNGAYIATTGAASFNHNASLSGTGASSSTGVHGSANISRVTGTPTLVTGAGVSGLLSVDYSNRMNWPTPGNIRNVPSGMKAEVFAGGGAQGTMAVLAGVTSHLDLTPASTGVTATKLFGFALTKMAGSNITNGVGAGIYDVSGTNKSYIVLSDTPLAVPSGDWAIYDDTGFDTRLSGNVSIGSDLVIDSNAILHQYGVALPKNNNTATAAPTANDDSGDDYSVGSVWFWPATGRIWKLRDATASAAQWVEIALADDQGYISGNWYMAPDISVTAGETVATGALQLVPMVFKSRVELSSLGVRITTAEHSGNLQLALYANDPATGRPTGNAVATTANISTGAVGPVSAAIAGGNVTLEPGLYWAAFAVDSTASNLVAVQVPSPDNHPTAALIGASSQANLGASEDSDLVSLHVAQTFGTWPSLTSATFVEGSTPSRNGPALHFQVA